MGLRGLVLGGAVAGLSLLPSCGWVAAYIIAQDAATTIANGQRDAARIQAEAMGNPGDYGRNNSNSKNQENVDFQMPTNNRLSHSELIKMLRTHNVSPEKIAEAKLANVAYDPLFGYTMSPICNYGQDLNNNGRIEGPEELFGIGSQFIEGDPILIGMGCERDSNIGEAIYGLFDSRGNKIDELRKPSSTEICPDSKELYTSVNIAYNHTELLKYPKRDEPVRRDIRLSSGTYCATLHSGTNLITSREFTIVPKQQ